MSKIIYLNEQRRTFHIKGYDIWAFTYEEAMFYYKLITEK